MNEMRAIPLLVYSLLVTAGMSTIAVSPTHERLIRGSGDELELSVRQRSDRISSLRQNTSLTTQSRGDWYIVFFTQTNYRGRPTTFRTMVSSLTGSQRRVGSVTIGEGVWQLCTGNHFTGRCVTLDQNLPGLSPHNMRNRVSSVRPVAR